MRIQLSADLSKFTKLKKSLLFSCVDLLDTTFQYSYLGALFHLHQFA
jgi:hypothetical protein